VIWLLLLSAAALLLWRERPIPSSEIQGCDLVIAERIAKQRGRT
jgi:hypothetical protein